MLRQLNTVLQQPPRARHKPKHPFAKLHHSEEEHLAVSTDADLVYVHLGRTAAKLNVSEERLRGNLLSLQGAYLETNRDGLSVALAKSVAEESGLSHMSCQPTMVPRARSVTPYHLGARSPRVYQGTPRTKVEERAPHIPVRWKKPQTPTHGAVCYGFAGGVRGPNMQLKRSTSDLEWMQRFMPNENKSTGMLDRQYEATKKEKPSVSDYHDRVLLYKQPDEVVLRRFSTLGIPDIMKQGREQHPCQRPVSSPYFDKPVYEVPKQFDSARIVRVGRARCPSNNLAPWPTCVTSPHSIGDLPAIIRSTAKGLWQDNALCC